MLMTMVMVRWVTGCNNRDDGDNDTVNTNCKREGRRRLHNNQPNMTMMMTMKRMRTRTRMMLDNKYDNDNQKPQYFTQQPTF